MLLGSLEYSIPHIDVFASCCTQNATSAIQLLFSAIKASEYTAVVADMSAYGIQVQWRAGAALSTRNTELRPHLHTYTST